MFEFYWLSDLVSVVWLTTFIYRNKYLKGCSSQLKLGKSEKYTDK